MEDMKKPSPAGEGIFENKFLAFARHILLAQ